MLLGFLSASAIVIRPEVANADRVCRVETRQTFYGIRNVRVCYNVRNSNVNSRSTNSANSRTTSSANGRSTSSANGRN